MTTKPKLSLKSGKSKESISPAAVEKFGNQAPVAKKAKAATQKKKTLTKKKARVKKSKTVPVAGKTTLKSFKLFEDEDASLNDLILRAAVTAKAIYTKTDMVRAGIMALSEMPDQKFTKILGQLRQTKPGPAAKG